MSIDLSRDRSREFIPRLASLYTAACFSVLSPILFDRTDLTAPYQEKKFSIWNPKNSSRDERRIIVGRIRDSESQLIGHLAHYDRIATLSKQLEEISGEETGPFVEVARELKYAIGLSARSIEDNNKAIGNLSPLQFPANPNGTGHFYINARKYLTRIPINKEETFLDLDRDLLLLGLARKDFLHRKLKVGKLYFGKTDSFGILRDKNLTERLLLVVNSLEAVGLSA